MIEIKDIKRIISHEFEQERIKRRLTDEDKNKDLVSHIGNALTTIEMNVKKSIQQLEQGINIYEIVPKTSIEIEQEEREKQEN